MTYINPEKDKVRITYFNFSEDARKAFWNAYGPKYYVKTKKADLKSTISKKFNIENSKSIEAIVSHLEDEDILIDYGDKYGVNMAKQP
jgi:hypothetical protein